MIRITAQLEEEKEVEDWEKAALWEFHNGSLPLFLDKDIEKHIKWKVIKMNKTDKLLKKGLDVHEFGQAIQDNKHLYSEEEFMFLCGQWVKDYEQYLISLVKQLNQ